MAEKKFIYGDYTESAAVKAAKDALDAQLAKKPGAYTSAWQNKLDEVLDKIQNREEFKYDLNGDALYQQYKDKYIQQGKMAMMDTMGQAAALTGGYGSSYAQSVGQQAYQEHLQGLNDKVPQLYQLALDKYKSDGDDLYNKYALLSDAESQDYGRYRDTVSDWQSEQDRLQGIYDSERNYDYNRYVDDRDYTYGIWSDAEDRAYQEQRDAIADQQWQQEMAFRQSQFDYEKQQDALAQLAAQKVSGSSGGSGYDNGGLTTAQIKEMQKYYGTTADGKWGSNSKAAAGDKSAKDAWAAYQKATNGGGTGGGATLTSSAALNAAIKAAGTSIEGQLLELQAMNERGQITDKQLKDLAYALTNPNK